ncbi:hypothetical protein D9613_002816 [Agrocybe pediades]|uniref:Uncharacterized protein n=1 Tax=Agrocybe pediades TaxID=84607 RepID=A0A8H4VNV2_9AGAR|nr:hypothetical protein D9613_002816 [Agrocybe pediades]
MEIPTVIQLCAQQVMGPGDQSMSSQSNIKVSTLPKLQEDGSNWVTFKERVLNNLTSKGLMRHVRGTAKCPEIPFVKNGEYFISSKNEPLTDAQLEAQEVLVDAYDQKQAQVRETIYEITPKSVFLEVKDELTAAEVWNKLVSIHESKGTMIYTDTLAKLASMRYVDGKSMRAHISSMKELKERLDEMGNLIGDDQFSAYVQAQTRRLAVLRMKGASAEALLADPSTFRLHRWLTFLAGVAPALSRRSVVINPAFHVIVGTRLLTGARALHSPTIPCGFQRDSLWIPGNGQGMRVEWNGNGDDPLNPPIWHMTFCHATSRHQPSSDVALTHMLTLHSSRFHHIHAHPIPIAAHRRPSTMPATTRCHPQLAQRPPPLSSRTRKRARAPSAADPVKPVSKRVKPELVVEPEPGRKGGKGGKGGKKDERGKEDEAHQKTKKGRTAGPKTRKESAVKAVEDAAALAAGPPSHLTGAERVLKASGVSIAPPPRRLSTRSTATTSATAAPTAPSATSTAAAPTPRPATRRRRSDNVASESPSTTDNEDDEGEDAVPLRSRGSLDDDSESESEPESAKNTESAEEDEGAVKPDNVDPTDNTEDADSTGNAKDNNNADNIAKNNNAEDDDAVDNAANTDDDDNASTAAAKAAAAIIKTRVAAAIASAKVADFGTAPSIYVVDKAPVATVPEMPQTPPKKGQDVVMDSPSPKIELRGSSRTTGEIARGHAVGNHPNIADLEEISSLSATPLSTGKVKVYVSNASPETLDITNMKPAFTAQSPQFATLALTLQLLAGLYPPIEDAAQRLYILDEDSDWMVQGSFNKAIGEDTTIHWSGGQNSNKMCTFDHTSRSKSAATSSRQQSVHAEESFSAEDSDSPAGDSRSMNRKRMIEILGIKESLTTSASRKDTTIRFSYIKYKAVLEAFQAFERTKAAGEWAGYRLATDTQI